VGNDVYGNKLVGIADTKIYLEASGQKVTLELYAKKIIGPPGNIPGGANEPRSAGQQQFSQTFSRSELKTKSLQQYG